VFTLSRDYFRLRKGLERRLYELARKHCGLQAKFTIGLDTLLKKSGAMCSLKKFRRKIKEVVTSNTLPDYSLEFDPAGDVVTIKKRPSFHNLAFAANCLHIVAVRIDYERGVVNLADTRRPYLV